MSAAGLAQLIGQRTQLTVGGETYQIIAANLSSDSQHWKIQATLLGPPVMLIGKAVQLATGDFGVICDVHAEVGLMPAENQNLIAMTSFCELVIIGALR